jgi:hypothetical protein
VDVPPSFWETLSTHPHIKNLALSFMRLQEDDTPDFWKTCMKLESLNIRRIDINNGDGFPRNVVFGWMRKLSMSVGYTIPNDYQLDLVLQSPMLETLEWEVDQLLVVRERFIDCRWPQFKALHLSGIHLKDKELEFMLNVSGGDLGIIDDLQLWHCEIGAQAFEALGVHFNTLVKVDISWASLIMRSIPSDLLCFCLRLEVLLVKDVFAKDAAERGPWVCQKLRELNIRFRFQESEQDLHQMICGRLSTLIRLERLTIQYPNSNDVDCNEGLVLRLDSGLELLASLQHLTHFCILTAYNRRFRQLGMEEVAWMVSNWKKLRSIEAQLNDNKWVKDQLLSVFESHGIAVQ